MNTTEESFGPIVFSYTRAQAIADGVLVDVSEMAEEAGVRMATALTQAVYEKYVAVPESLEGLQDESGRLWDILWMFTHAVRSGRMDGSQGTFTVIVALPDRGDWSSNESPFEGQRTQRLVTLKAVCGPEDDGAPCITVMLPTED
jgi:hypothetical protein